MEVRLTKGCMLVSIEALNAPRRCFQAPRFTGMTGNDGQKAQESLASMPIPREREREREKESDL